MTLLYINPKFLEHDTGVHPEDPIGSLGLDVEDFRWLTDLSVEIANQYASGRLISALEGGYNPPVLAECVAAHLKGLL